MISDERIQINFYVWGRGTKRRISNKKGVRDDLALSWDNEGRQRI